jgi:hypothetical protein
MRLTEHTQYPEEVDLNDLITSYIHMMMNRSFRSRQRIHELVLYDFLYRYYKSVIARPRITEEALLIVK